jgi:hypothetical protein
MADMGLASLSAWPISMTAESGENEKPWVVARHYLAVHLYWLGRHGWGAFGAGTDRSYRHLVHRFVDDDQWLVYHHQ